MELHIRKGPRPESYRVFEGDNLLGLIWVAFEYEGVKYYKWPTVIYGEAANSKISAANSLWSDRRYNNKRLLSEFTGIKPK